MKIHSRLILVPVFVAICLSFMAGCMRPTPELDVVRERGPEFHLVPEWGMAITPVGLEFETKDAVHIAGFVTTQLSTAIMINWAGSPLVDPAAVLANLRADGGDGLERFRSFRDARMKGLPLLADDCSAMSKLVQRRYVLISWLLEAREEGIEQDSVDYTDVAFANEVRRNQFARIQGKLTGVVVDLWEAEVVWDGSSSYLTQKLYGNAEVDDSELARARDHGVLKLAALLSSP